MPYGFRMDALDRKILDIIQADFPLTPRPYACVGERTGLTEAEVLARVRALRQQGVIRRLGASFQSRRMGWHSTLCAAKTPLDRLDAFVARVNELPGVTHNYLRDHEFNVWFTLIAPSPEDACQTLAALSEATGVEILDLPAERLFKIKVEFPMDQGADPGAASS